MSRRFLISKKMTFFLSFFSLVDKNDLLSCGGHLIFCEEKNKIWKENFVQNYLSVSRHEVEGVCCLDVTRGVCVCLFV